MKNEYQHLQVDALPIYDVPKKLDYKVLIKKHQDKKGNPLDPVKQRKNKPAVPKNHYQKSVILWCSHCGITLEKVTEHRYFYKHKCEMIIISYISIILIIYCQKKA